MLRKILLAAGSIALMTLSIGNAQAADPANTIVMDLSTGGPVKIELRPDLAPKHAERIKTLVKEGFYNGLIWHRVIDGFMAQTGDPTGTGTSGSKYPDLPAEFSDENYGRGTVGMARKSDPNSANSQFFICFNDCSFLNGQYTVVGQVTEGIEYVDKLARGEPPANPDKIVKMQIEADMGTAAPAAEAAPAGNAADTASDAATNAAKEGTAVESAPMNAGAENNGGVETTAPPPAQ